VIIDDATFQIILNRPDGPRRIQLTVDSRSRAILFSNFLHWLHPECEVTMQRVDTPNRCPDGIVRIQMDGTVPQPPESVVRPPCMPRDS
jgi:hypothetical protein